MLKALDPPFELIWLIAGRPRAWASASQPITGSTSARPAKPIARAVRFRSGRGRRSQPSNSARATGRTSA